MTNTDAGASTIALPEFHSGQLKMNDRLSLDLNVAKSSYPYQSVSLVTFAYLQPSFLRYFDTIHTCRSIEIRNSFIHFSFVYKSRKKVNFISA